MHNSVQSFSCKINCTEVIVATKLHKTPDESDRARSRSLLQMRDSWPKPRLQGTPDSTPCWWTKTVLLA